MPGQSSDTSNAAPWPHKTNENRRATTVDREPAGSRPRPRLELNTAPASRSSLGQFAQRLGPFHRHRTRHLHMIAIAVLADRRAAVVVVVVVGKDVVEDASRGRHPSPTRGWRFKLTGKPADNFSCTVKRPW